MAKADFNFEDGYDFRHKPVVTLNLDGKGMAHPYDTVGTWQFECWERDHDHQAKLAQCGELVARANRTDKDFYWDCSYVSSESHLEGIANGFGDSFEDCERAFTELWNRIRRHRTCSYRLPDDFHHYCKDEFVDGQRKVA